MDLFHLFAKRSLPRVEGTITVRGLHAPVEVIRDRWGVPHIYAESIEDALFAQGFVHAQDRLWQMDVNRRAGQGRLSEIFGSRTLDLDRFARTVGFTRAAQAELDAADPESLRLLDAYVAGVNAWVERGQRPVEHRLLRAGGVEPWTRLDTASWGVLLAWGLSWNWESELERLALWKRLGPDEAAAMESEYPDSQASILAEAAGVEDTGAHLLDAYRRLSSWLLQSGGGAGSNNWVLAGKRTATGRPMLANDPHLRLTLPSIWYENHLVVAPLQVTSVDPSVPSVPLVPSIPADSSKVRNDPPLHVTGITLPGVPGVILGHNERIAWGATATIADTQDLYLERFDPDDPSRFPQVSGVQVSGAQVQMIRESIRVRFRRKPVEHVVRVTRHGPIIDDICGVTVGRSAEADGVGSNDFSRSTTARLTPLRFATGASESQLPSSPARAGATYHLALKWTAHQPGGWLRALFALNRAADWESFKYALRGWHAPVVNMVYADVDDNIAYRVAGRIPIRKSGHGLMPVAGWTDDHEWVGEIPFDDLPELTPQDEAHAANNPTTRLPDYPTTRLTDHTIVTAINRIAGPEYPYFISTEWLNGHRAARIRERLDACERVSIEDSVSIQMDVKSQDAAEIVDHLLALRPHTEREAGALERLRAWDSTLSAESVAASIYEVTQIELVRLLFAEKLGPAFGGYIGDGQTELFVNVNFTNIALRQVRMMLGTRMNADERGYELLRDALRAALDRLTARFGPDMHAWKWGELHRVEPAHVLSQNGLLRRLFNRGSYPVGGDGDTPLQGAFRPAWPIEYAIVAPSYRVVYDVGDWDQCVAVLPGGQSGHPASPHYFDQFSLWLAGKARPMLWSREAVEREVESRMRLLPQRR